MKIHDWTGIEWGREFGFEPKTLEIQGEGSIEPGDEVIVRLRVDTVDRYWDEPGQFMASLVPVGCEPVRFCSRGIPVVGNFVPAGSEAVQAIWQRLISFLKWSV